MLYIYNQSYTFTFSSTHLKFHKERIIWLVNANYQEQTNMENLNIGDLHLTRLGIFSRFVTLAGTILDNGELFLVQIQRCRPALQLNTNSFAHL